MFDFAWSEIALIGVVALIAIGPKDMPVAIRAMSKTMKKLRRMAGEFQGHVDEMIREADLGDVKASFDELRGMNPRRLIQRAIDPDGTVRNALADPFAEHPVQPVPTTLDQVHAGEPVQEAAASAEIPASTEIPSGLPIVETGHAAAVEPAAPVAGQS